MTPSPTLPANATAQATVQATTPITPRALFIAFSKMALIGFGGTMPVAYRTLVERLRWVSAAEFAELLAFAQILPGATICNLTLMIGYRRAGLVGACASLAGILFLPLIIVSILGLFYLYFGDIPLVHKALIGMSAAAAGLVLATALKMMVALLQPKLGTREFLGLSFFAALAFLGVGVFHFPLIVVVASLAPISIIYVLIRGE